MPFFKKHDLCRYVKGQGVEIGALSKPLEIDNRKTHVIYVDVADKEDLIKHNPEVPAQEIKSPDIINDAEELKDIRDESVDFVIASHLLEHLANPIKALGEFHRILKTGGVLYLSVPDKRYCFDKERPLTSLSHLLDDYRQGATLAGSAAHYQEWLTAVELKKPHPVASTLEELMAKNYYRIHFHTWVPETLAMFFNYLNNNLGIHFGLADYYYHKGDVNIILILKKGGSGCAMPSFLKERYSLIKLALYKLETFVLDMENKIKDFLKRKLAKHIFLWNSLLAIYHFPDNVKIRSVACREWLKAKNAALYFEYFYKKNKNPVKIVLADFAGYPFFREKIIAGDVIKCGIGPLLENMAKFRAGVTFGVILVVNSRSGDKQDQYEFLQKKYPFIENIFFRDNTGFDFGAYNKGYQYLRSIRYEGDILFMNSSVRGPYDDHWLLKYSWLFHRRKDIGLCGISLNSHSHRLMGRAFMPHVQSFFMYTSMQILTKVFKDSLPAADIVTSDQLDIISRGEIEFSRILLDSGYGICSKLFENFVYYKNVTWKIPQGCPRYSKVYHQFANRI